MLGALSYKKLQVWRSCLEATKCRRGLLGAEPFRAQVENHFTHKFRKGRTMWVTSIICAQYEIAQTLNGEALVGSELCFKNRFHCLHPKALSSLTRGKKQAPLNASPGNHDAIVCAQQRWGAHQAQPRPAKPDPQAVCISEKGECIHERSPFLHRKVMPDGGCRPLCWCQHLHASRKGILRFGRRFLQVQSACLSCQGWFGEG